MRISFTEEEWQFVMNTLMTSLGDYSEVIGSGLGPFKTLKEVDALRKKLWIKDGREVEDLELLEE